MPLAVDYGQGISDAFSRIATFIPQLILFLIILVIGFFVAKAIQKILAKVLQKVGFDDLVERGGVKKALDKSKYDAATILARVVFYFIFLIVLGLAFSAFGGNNPVEQFLGVIIGYLPNLFVAILALVIAAAVAAAVKELLGDMLGDTSYGAVLSNVAAFMIVGIGVFFALDELNIAPLIVGGIFYALLALIIVPPIIAFGVGGIEPARDAIRGMQSKAGEQAQQMQQQMSSGGEQGQQGGGQQGQQQYDDEYDDQYDEQDEVPVQPRARPVRRAPRRVRRMPPS